MLTVESIRASHAGSYYTEPQSGTFRTEWKAKGSDKPVFERLRGRRGVQAKGTLLF